MNYAIFKRPSRYINREINSIRKNGEIKVALCFPDTYEIGMSHLGLKILYSIINSVSYASAERVYAPWIDYEEYLRQHRMPLSSLEFRRPLREFDIIGFTLQYELSYTNILNMLDLGGIPVRANHRGDEQPIVIAGGPCAVNPLPLRPFIDAFVIGDGEEVIGDILEKYRSVSKQGTVTSGQGTGDGKEGKRGKCIGRRKEVLNALAGIEGVYVPSVHDSGGMRIMRRIVQDLDNVPFPAEPVVPYNQIVHDRVAIEIARGCSRGCRFCQAGLIYRPVRERSVDNVLSIAKQSIESSGYEEISFVSLSAGDYRDISSLVNRFNRCFRESLTAVSLPSMRVDSITRGLLEEIKDVKKTGFTIAPEAGTERLRAVINKDFSSDEYERTLDVIFSAGWRHIKLYFMIGLPTETWEDIDGLIDMAVYATIKGRQVAGRRVNVNVGISAFVPKPHTPFQWDGQESVETLREKQDYIRRAFRKRGINFKGQHVENSLLEAVFSRADECGADLIEAAWKAGCRFDGWTEHFDFNKWLLAADKTGMNLYEYAARRLDPEEELPWDFVDTGIRKQFLVSEYQRALSERYSEDCRRVCHGCGLKCKEQSRHKSCQLTVESGQWRLDKRHGEGNRGEGRRTTSQRNVRAKFRVRFSKTGIMRCLSHHELITTMVRALRRARIPVSYSEGFHPHPKLSFGPALPVGVEGINEYFDIELDQITDRHRFTDHLNNYLPEGLKIREAVFLSGSTKSLNELFSVYDYEIDINEDAHEDVETFIKSPSCIINRNQKEIDVRKMVRDAGIRDQTLYITLADSPQVRARLHDVLEAIFGNSGINVSSLRVRRTALKSYNSQKLKAGV